MSSTVSLVVLALEVLNALPTRDLVDSEGEEEMGLPWERSELDSPSFVTW